jgi:hypothetical protein
LLNILCHRLDSEPPTSFVDVDQLPDGDNFYFILGSPTKQLLDVIHNLFKPTLGEVLLHLWIQVSAMLLQSSIGELLSSDEFGFVSFRDLDVISFFVKSLIVRVML